MLSALRNQVRRATPTRPPHPPTVALRGTAVPLTYAPGPFTSSLRRPVAAQALHTSPRRPSGYRRFGDPPPKPRLSGPTTSSSSSFTLPRQLRNLRRPPTVVLVVLGGGGLYYVSHLEQVPHTGRWRFMDVSPSLEKNMGQQGYGEVMSEYRGRILDSRHPSHRYVEAVARRIVKGSGLDKGGVAWECHVIEDGSKNAFVLPGGKIFVFTGILPVCANENGLAVVLGHEIAHQVARHSAERMSSMKVLYLLSIVLQSAGLDLGISRVLLNLLLTLPNSRQAESEADYIGLELATAACFDPREAKALWQRMEAGEGGAGSIDFLSTHPASGKRVQKVEKWAKEIIEMRPESCGPLERQWGAFREASTTKSRW